MFGLLNLFKKSIKLRVAILFSPNSVVVLSSMDYQQLMLFLITPN